MKVIKLKRAYQEVKESDGSRVLVDRLWPRGIKKEVLQLTLWAKDVAPSNEIRKWYCHKVELFPTFREKYVMELVNDEEKSKLVDQLCELAKEGPLTLIYAAKDEVHNNAVVLKEEILRRLESRIKRTPIQ